MPCPSLSRREHELFCCGRVRESVTKNQTHVLRRRLYKGEGGVRLDGGQNILHLHYALCRAGALPVRLSH